MQLQVLPDMLLHVFSANSVTFRFIQQKLERASQKEKQAVFDEVALHAQSLMTDVFGNYVIQKFFEYGTTEQKNILTNAVKVFFRFIDHPNRNIQFRFQR